MRKRGTKEPEGTSTEAEEIGGVGPVRCEVDKPYLRVW